jgi:3',5'-cyclic AMP phosphodiesterase CpdA
MEQTLAHISDLHLPNNEDRTRALAAKLRETKPDLVVVSGDITDLGDDKSYELFHSIFDGLPYIAIPGNHDGEHGTHTFSLGDKRVSKFTFPGLHLIAVDARRLTRGEAWWWKLFRKVFRTEFGVGHTEGELLPGELAEIENLVKAVPEDQLCALTTHWPITPIEFGEIFPNTWSFWLGWPVRNEVKYGRRLLQSIFPKCRLVLHGHRHEQKEVTYRIEEKLVRLHNAGAAFSSSRFKVFTHENGEIVKEEWIDY